MISIPSNLGFGDRLPSFGLSNVPTYTNNTNGNQEFRHPAGPPSYNAAIAGTSGADNQVTIVTQYLQQLN